MWNRLVDTVGEVEGGTDVYTYGWFLLMYGRNQHHAVSKYPPIKNKYIKKEKEKLCKVETKRQKNIWRLEEPRKDMMGSYIPHTQNWSIWHPKILLSEGENVSPKLALSNQMTREEVALINILDENHSALTKHHKNVFVFPFNTHVNKDWPRSPDAPLGSCNIALQLPLLGSIREGQAGSHGFLFYQNVTSLYSSAVSMENAWGAWIFMLICQWWDFSLSSSLGWCHTRLNEQSRFWPSASSSKLPTHDVSVSYVGKNMKHLAPPTQRFNMGALPSGTQNSYPYSAVTVRVEKLDFHPQLAKISNDSLPGEHCQGKPAKT